MMNKIKLVFDFWPIVICPRTGIYFAVRNLFLTLVKRDEIELSLYINAPLTKKKLKELNADLGVDISQFRQLLPSSDFSGQEAFFSALFAVPESIKKYNLANFVLLYDLTTFLFPEHFESSCKNSWCATLCRSMNNQDHYFAISEYTRLDFLKYFPHIDPRSITATPIATNFEYHPNKNKKQQSVTRKKYNIPADKKYLFSLCSLQPRKNLIRAVRCFIKFIKKNKIDDLVFVLGGGAWGSFIERLEKEVPEYKKYKNKIIRAGYVDDEDLEILYSNAEWFVYTSQYEGFGMPPLEAMACGTAVITSNNSSLPEVVGDAGIMIDWDSDEQHIAAYEKYYFDPKFRQTMAQKGLKRAQNFSWDKTVEIMMPYLRVNAWALPPKTTTTVANILPVQTQAIYTPTVQKQYIKLFGFLPFVKIVSRQQKTKYYLFNFLPIWKIIQTNNATKYYFLGISLCKIKSVKK